MELVVLRGIHILCNSCDLQRLHKALHKVVHQLENKLEDGELNRKCSFEIYMKGPTNSRGVFLLVVLADNYKTDNRGHH